MKKALLSLFTIYYLLSTTTALAQSVDILYQGMTYTPPFYLGGSVWSGESVIEMVAVPQGLGSPSQLFYKWSKNGTVLGNTNGIGKNSLVFSDTIFSKPVSIKVEILAADDTVLAESDTTVVPDKSSLLVYEKNPLYGYLFHQEASGGYIIPEEEISFAVFPLYFSVPNPEYQSLRYAWRSNGREDSAENLVTYRIPEGTSGRSEVSVKLENTNTIRQMVEKRFLVQFGNENSK